ncbi:MAG: 4Fe-4S dicluster domain-containing protein, partial [bacterium]|nr:4Fe-4S dicluster domain-containing protein [bacterium]
AKIDQSLCTGCGLCIAVCSHDTITLKDKKAYVTGDASLNCGHCAAACPVNAIDVKLIDRSLSEFQTFSGKSRWLPHGEFDIKSLVNLMQSRRTCRNYTDRTVSRTMLEDLVKIGISAPSGSNCQMWTFTIFPDRKAVVNFGKHIGDFYKKLNNMAKRAWLRHLLRIFGQP